MTVAPRADLHFYFDPVCPFAWLTSKWVRVVAAQRDYQVEWRFISLRILNAHIDYGAHFPAGYADGHTAGLRLLRVAARVRAEHGKEAVGPLYEAIGTRVFDTPRTADPLSAADQGARRVLEPLLTEIGLPVELADALDDTSLDAEIRAETEQALTLTGRDVGTPILHFSPPEGTAFFGPVISRVPADEDAGRLWDHIVGLASFGGFAELKRSLRKLTSLAQASAFTPNSSPRRRTDGGSLAAPAGPRRGQDRFQVRGAADTDVLHAILLTASGRTGRRAPSCCGFRRRWLRRRAVEPGNRVPRRRCICVTVTAWCCLLHSADAPSTRCGIATSRGIPTCMCRFVVSISTSSPAMPTLPNEYWPNLARIYPPYRSYRQATDRVIPLVVRER